MSGNQTGDDGPGEQADLHVALGRWLRLLRTRKGLSLAAVAEQSGLSQSFLSQMERGLVQPSLRSVNRVASALGTTASAVFALQASDPVSTRSSFRTSSIAGSPAVAGRAIRILQRGRRAGRARPGACRP
jgi:transcriptional regulator with XRE-family HTH domain